MGPFCKTLISMITHQWATDCITSSSGVGIQNERSTGDLWGPWHGFLAPTDTGHTLLSKVLNLSELDFPHWWNEMLRRLNKRMDWKKPLWKPGLCKGHFWFLLLEPTAGSIRRKWAKTSKTWHWLKHSANDKSPNKEKHPRYLRDLEQLDKVVKIKHI